MGLIHRSAYLTLHPHVRLAHIVYSNGNKSQALATKRQALEIGEAMRDIDMIPADEWKAVREQIHASPLPDRSLFLEDMCNKLEGRLDELERKLKHFEAHQRDEDLADWWKNGGDESEE